jgi:hypothetical protein
VFRNAPQHGSILHLYPFTSLFPPIKQEAAGSSSLRVGIPSPVLAVHSDPADAGEYRLSDSEVRVGDRSGGIIGDQGGLRANVKRNSSLSAKRSMLGAFKNVYARETGGLLDSCYDRRDRQQVESVMSQSSENHDKM